MLETLMRDLLAEYPSARRALFTHFHIGGCQSCAFSEEATLAEVCQAHEIDPAAAEKAIRDSHQEEQAFLLTPHQLEEKLASTFPPILLDCRTREEHEAVAITGSDFLTESTLSRLTSESTDREIVLYDHTGRAILDQVSWFRGHGLKKTFALAGGIDAWSQTVEPSLPRYRLEFDSKGNG